MFGYTFAGLAVAYVAVQAIGVPPPRMLTDQTAAGVRQVMGGGVLGALALLVIALGSVASNAMNDYSGSLALQTVGRAGAQAGVGGGGGGASRSP